MNELKNNVYASTTLKNKHRLLMNKIIDRNDVIELLLDSIQWGFVCSHFYNSTSCQCVLVLGFDLILLIGTQATT